MENLNLNAEPMMLDSKVTEKSQGQEPVRSGDVEAVRKSNSLSAETGRCPNR